MDSHLPTPAGEAAPDWQGRRFPVAEPRPPRPDFSGSRCPEAAGPQVAGALTACRGLREGCSRRGGACPGHQAAHPTELDQPCAGQALQAQRHEGQEQACRETALPPAARPHGSARTCRWLETVSGGREAGGWPAACLTLGPYALPSSGTPGTQHP